MPSPSPAIGQREAATTSTTRQQCHTCGGQWDSRWRKQVDRLLSLIVERVTGVEETLGTVLGGIADIGAELDVIGHRLGQSEDGEHTYHTYGGLMKETHPDVAASTPSNRHRCLGESHVGEPLTDKGSPTSPQNVSVRDTGGARGGLRHPIVVDDDRSSHSGHGKAACGASGLHVAPIAARVHANPRMRLPPFAQRVLGLESPAKGATETAEASPKQAPHATKYKDPPGYEDVADFGASRDTGITPPILHPKKIGVSFWPNPTTTLCNCYHCMWGILI